MSPTISTGIYQFWRVSCLTTSTFLQESLQSLMSEKRPGTGRREVAGARADRSLDQSGRARLGTQKASCTVFGRCEAPGHGRPLRALAQRYRDGSFRRFERLPYCSTEGGPRVLPGFSHFVWVQLRNRWSAERWTKGVGACKNRKDYPCAPTKGPRQDWCLCFAGDILR